MKCIKCDNTIHDKKLEHPLIKDSYLCISCFDLKLNSNRVSFSRNISLFADFSESSLHNDIDLGFILCTEGKNNNRDGFDEEGLSQDHPTVVNQRLDWEHTNEVVGTITASEFIKADSFDRKKELGINISKSLIYAKGLLWKFWNRDRAQEVVARHRIGSLFYSMEDIFDYSICSSCNKSYAFDDEYCTHLNSRFSPNSDTYRILRGNRFAGAGVVEKPADIDAVALSIAKDQMRLKIISQVLDPDIYDYYLYSMKRKGMI